MDALQAVEDGRQAPEPVEDGHQEPEPVEHGHQEPEPDEHGRQAHHAFTISGGPFGPIPGTHVFPRSETVGELVAKLLEATVCPGGGNDAGAAAEATEASPPYALANVSVDPGGYYRGDNEITLPSVLANSLRDGLKDAETWTVLLKMLRTRQRRERLDEFHERNPERKGERNRERNSDRYLVKKFIAVDFEGQDYIGNVIKRPNGKDSPTPYDDHRLFMGGAASIDDNVPPEWLVNPDTTDDDKKPLDPRALLEWLVSLPEKFNPMIHRDKRNVVFVMYSFSYDVTHILRHLRFEKTWEIFKEEKYDKDRKKRRKIKGRVFCGHPFDDFVMKYRNRKQLDIWKLRDPKERWERWSAGGEYVLEKDGKKKLDYVSHITLFDTHPFFQQSFVKAADFLVKIGKAKQADFDFMKAMKGKRDRFSTEPLEEIKAYTELELRYLAMMITELRQILHDIRLECAPNMRPIHISSWYGPGAVARVFLENLNIIKNHYGDHVRAIDPSPMQEAAHHAFSAGNIQLVKVGHGPDAILHSMDIASAYPHAISQLPSMAGGEWAKFIDNKFNSLAQLRASIEAASSVSMFHLDYQFPLYEQFDKDDWRKLYIPWYPLFFRSSSEAIFYPRRGEGWYMRDEALAAVAFLEHYIHNVKWRDDGTPITKQWELKDTHFIVKLAWLFHPHDPDARPFAFLHEIYNQRMQYKRAEIYDAREKFYKLPPNSIYGKMAQRIGGTETKEGWKAPPTANPFYAAATTANCRLRLVEAGLHDPHAVVAFMTDGIVTTRRLENLSNVVNEGEESKLGDWEYAPVDGGTFLHAGVYSMRKAGKELTKTRGVDPKRVSADDKAGELLVSKAVEAMSREYDPDWPPAISLPIRDLITIGQALMACENNRDMWKAGLAGRWAPPIDSDDAVSRAINLEKLGTKRRWIPGREDDWQTRRRPDGTLRLANRCVTLVPTIPAENPEPPGTLSKKYSPDWLDPELGESVEDGDEQEAIEEGMF